VFGLDAVFLAIAGSDAVHQNPDYSCVYITLTTDRAIEGWFITSQTRDVCVVKLELSLKSKHFRMTKQPAGYGFTFTLGRGNEIVAKCVEALAFLVIGKNFETEVCISNFYPSLHFPPLPFNFIQQLSCFVLVSKRCC
jgi:hypothetical protein